MNQSVLSIRNMTLMAMFVALLAVSGMFAIPVGPAPISLQTLVVMLAGSVLGARRGLISMLVFLLLVAVGAPVLSGGKGGMAALFGPTGGFIISWPLAAFIIGILAEKLAAAGKLNAFTLTLAHITGGILLVHLIGFPWLVYTLHLPLNMETFTGSFLIFLPGDLLKSVVATSVAFALYRAMPGLKPMGK